MSLCPPVTKKTQKANFYLRSLECTNPAQWYSSQVVGMNTLRKTVGELLKSVELDGFFSNNSLRQTGTSRLFQAGFDRKIVKEYSGHRSDAIDRYQVTSESQKQQVSKVLAGEIDDKKECDKVTLPSNSNNRETALETSTCKNCQ